MPRVRICRRQYRCASREPRMSRPGPTWTRARRTPRHRRSIASHPAAGSSPVRHPLHPCAPTPCNSILLPCPLHRIPTRQLRHQPTLQRLPTGTACAQPDTMLALAATRHAPTCASWSSTRCLRDLLYLSTQSTSGHARSYASVVQGDCFQLGGDGKTRRSSLNFSLTGHHAGCNQRKISITPITLHRGAVLHSNLGDLPQMCCDRFQWYDSPWGRVVTARIPSSRMWSKEDRWVSHEDVDGLR